MKLKNEFTVIEEGAQYEVPNYEVVDGVGIEQVFSGQLVSFVRGSKLGDEEVERRVGTLHEHLLAVMIHDLKFKNTLAPSRETALATTKLEEALHWLWQRQVDRLARGVEGTHKK